MTRPIKISVISDVVCPWCYLGKRRLEKALEKTGIAVELTWLPYELNPDMPREGMARADYRARKFGAEKAAQLDQQMRERGEQEGVLFAFDKMTRTPNTRRAHVLISMAREYGLDSEMAEELFRLYFEEGADVGDVDTLAAAAARVGLGEADARTAIDDAARHRNVAEREAWAVEIGVSGVPFFIVEERNAVGGAELTENWVHFLARAAESIAEDAS